jgi:hypothetical protein
LKAVKYRSNCDGFEASSDIRFWSRRKSFEGFILCHADLSIRSPEPLCYGGLIRCNEEQNVWHIHVYNSYK